jgi:hypothetical protein
MDTEVLFRAAFDYAERTIIGAQKQLPPTWTLMNKAGEAFVIVTQWGNDAEKLLAEMMLKLEMQERKTVAYTFVVEAWAATAPEGWTPDKGKLDKMPSKRADRKEIVLAFVNDGKTVTSRMWSIKRDWHDRTASLELYKSGGSLQEFEGWMTRLLD